MVKILTIDDDATVRILIRTAFYAYACKIIEAADGAQGLTEALKERPDIILLDLEMPLMSGVAMLAKLRDFPELRSLPIIVLTADSSRENVVKVAKFGVRDYVIKPFKTEAIVERVSRLVTLEKKEKLAQKSKRWDEPLQILILDEKAIIFDQAKEAVAGTPWQVHGITQPELAMDACTDIKPDIIFISLALPDEFGFTLLKMFRTGHTTKSIPVVVLSLKGAEDEQARALEMGASGWVFKPVEAEDMQTKIIAALKLDCSYKYIHQREGYLLVRAPHNLNETIGGEILGHLRGRLREAVASGINRLILDMTQLQAADAATVRTGLNLVRLCGEMSMRHSVVASEPVRKALDSYEDADFWQFATSHEEGMALMSRALTTPAG